MSSFTHCPENLSHEKEYEQRHLKLLYHYFSYKHQRALKRRTGLLHFISVGDPDPDLDPQDPYGFVPPGSGSFHQQASNMQKTLKKTNFCWHLGTDENAGFGPGAGSVSQWYTFADPDPYKNVADPQHMSLNFSLFFKDNRFMYVDKYWTVKYTITHRGNHIYLLLFYYIF